MKDLSVVILTHNRPRLLEDTIQSVFNQTCHDFLILISDNSSNDETSQMLENNGWMDKLTYKKRDKEYLPFDHFNLILSEITTQYFIMFHDDDIMLPDFIETMYHAIAESEYIAVGCNAYCFGNKIKKEYLISGIKKDKALSNTDELICSYVSTTSTYVPFPSYIYSREKIGSLRFIDNAGKYSDVSWLLSLLKKNRILWISSPHIRYRFHQAQDSTTVDFRSSLRLIEQYKRYSSHSKKINKVIFDYRIRNLTGMMLFNIRHHKSKPSRLFLGILLRHPPFYYFTHKIKKIKQLF